MSPISHNVLLALAFTPLLATSSPTKRIVGGQKAAPDQFPSLVVLSALTDNTPTAYYQFCGGSLLNPTTVLTAAHCLNWYGEPEPQGFNVRAGSLLWQSGGVSSNVSSYVTHPKYNASSTDYDFAILKLKTPIESNGKSIEYACLEESTEDPKAGTKGIVAGWGLDSDGGYRRPDLYYVEIPVVGREQCDADFKSRDVSITPQEFCVGTPQGGTGDCSGDSGGPYYVDGKVTGLVSWALAACAAAGSPSVYAKVGSAIDFIKEHL